LGEAAKGELWVVFDIIGRRDRLGVGGLQDDPGLHLLHRGGADG